ncbi:inner membrane protein [Trichosporon asahii var. asahii CBS 2479]|uniref:Sensitive to high expression protein 9, mitochondrial n=1 Tax=Trichosporon asahii var. asahii (strain ATCC 90039 / CBS 2479 / JCM 2466 / KCTC 7840 / NBRC 103889/ NCYC 2677 / UAMH 7654) TaxID=1186058 RepID=J6EUP7_TRIAS|nr:inner membrane protein [Trichosporon asahii var. asahii CBS 2479]EJT46487.1 inner membrane protein [Trichosporon asahii var. asahii CBS 2479]
MVLLRQSHRLWPAPRPISAFRRQPTFASRFSHHDAFKPDPLERSTSDDSVLPLEPPSPPEPTRSASSVDSIPDFPARDERPPEQRPSGSRSTEPSATALAGNVSTHSAVLQELLKQQRDQLQKEKDLQKEEEQLQKQAERKVKPFDLLDRRKEEDSGSAVTWADPVSVAEATAAATATATATAPSASLSMPSISTEEFKKRLAEWKTALDKKSRELAQQADKNFSLLGLRVNEVTGYREIELLKEAVKSRGASLTADVALTPEREIEGKRKNVREAKVAYETAVATLSKTQQDVQALLERKHTWSDHDVAHFTQLVRSDHASKNAVETTSQQLKEAELAVDTAFTALMQSILERYHEEQVWSDKIRSVSTWASLVVLGANLIVFVGAIAFVEPWKRKRLVEGLEERMTGMMTKVDSQLQTLSDRVGSLEPVSSSVLAAAPVAAVNSEVSPKEDGVNHISPSPIHTLEPHLSTVPYGSEAFAWSTDSLDKLAPPSAERDLAAAAAVGAVAGAVTISLISFIASLIRH